MMMIDPHHCLLVPVLEVVLQDAPLARLLARVRVGAGHRQLVQKPLQDQVAEKGEHGQYLKKKKTKL